MNDMPTQIRRYSTGLAEALKTEDVQAVRAFLKEWEPVFGNRVTPLVRQDDQQLEVTIRRMILERQDLSEQHAAARAWLEEHSPKDLRS